jgi:glycosyltransferase involved in cell wall biosynthesis
VAAQDLDVSVVVLTRNRARRLEAALASLHGQTIGSERFEVIVVDDGSTDDTSDVLAREAERGELKLNVITRDTSGGPAVARNDAWRAATGRVVAFMDDDCTAEPGWLDAGLDALGGSSDRFVQGATAPMPEELPRLGPFAYTYDIAEPTGDFPTCNMLYPRELIERLGGFDEDTFEGWGEDTDLAWRAKRAGAEAVFEPAARVRHAVVELGPAGFLRRAFSIGNAMFLVARYPELRRERLFYRVFWNLSHWYLARLWLCLLLPRGRWTWPLKLWLARPYLTYRLPHPRHGRPSPATLAWFLLVDSVEMAGVAGGGLRNRTLVL